MLEDVSTVSVVHRTEAAVPLFTRTPEVGHSHSTVVETLTTQYGDGYGIRRR